MSSSPASFFKGHGLGNDYLAIDAEQLGSEVTPAFVRLLCDRHVGIGSDGLLLAVDSGKADFGVRIFNPDGSEAEKSGNGLRIFAAYLLDKDRVHKGRKFSVGTLGGVVQMEILAETADGVMVVEVEMGKASFSSAAVGLTGPDRDVAGEILELPGEDRLEINVVSVGNPHCVCFQDELVVEDLRRRGPQISTHPWFERGTNVQFARVTGPADVEAFVWERGAGETMASGSSACAVAAVAVRRGLVQDHRVTVTMPGGPLVVTVRQNWEILLRGPVEGVFYATPTASFGQHLAELS